MHSREAGRIQEESRSWLDWLRPNPVSWAALGAAWAVILLLNSLAAAPEAPVQEARSRSKMAEPVMTLIERRQWLSQIVEPASVPQIHNSVPPSRAAPRPRSEGGKNWAMA